MPSKKSANKINGIQILLRILGILFLLFVIVVAFFSYKLSRRVKARVESPEYLTPTIVQDPTGVYTFEDLQNGYLKATSAKYYFTFEFNKKLIAHPPSSWNAGVPGMLESISFQTEKREKNDVSAGYIMTVSPEPLRDKSPCETLKTFPNWSTTTLNGMPAMQSGTNDKGTIVVCGSKFNYSLSYTPGTYTPKNEKELTPEELDFEKQSYGHILQSFTITE